MNKFNKSRKNEYGFSMMELLVVIAIIAIVAAIAIPNLVTSKKLIGGKIDQTKLLQIRGYEEDYRGGSGQRRYASLYELSRFMTPRGKLLPETIVKFSGTQPMAVDGILIRDNPNSPSTAAALASGYSIWMSRDGATGSDDLYCIHEDGVLRKSTVSAGCSRTSEAVKKE